MSSLTDKIERTILALIDEQDGACEIARNAFAAQLRVAPSQITYVISTRFSHRQGYVVESRRGGAGYVRIRRVAHSERSEFLMHLVRSVSDHLSQHDANVLLEQLSSVEFVSRNASQLVKAALSDGSLRHVDLMTRERVRADILRNMLTLLAAMEEEIG